MPTYEYKCPEHGVFDRQFAMSEMPQVVECGSCGAESPKQISLFGNISTSDDPSFGSARGSLSKRTREFSGFDPDNHGWVEKPKHNKSDWEYA